MARMLISAEGTVAAPAETVYRYIADMRDHHPHFLPPAFSDFRVESGLKRLDAYAREHHPA